MRHTAVTLRKILFAIILGFVNSFVFAASITENEANTHIAGIQTLIDNASPVPMDGSGWLGLWNSDEYQKIYSYGNDNNPTCLHENGLIQISTADDDSINIAYYSYSINVKCSGTNIIITDNLNVNGVYGGTDVLQLTIVIHGSQLVGHIFNQVGEYHADIFFIATTTIISDFFPAGMKWVSYTATCESRLQQSVLKVNETVTINNKTYSKIGDIPVRVENRRILILYEGEEYILYNFLLEEGDQIPVALFDNTDENEQIMMATVIATDTITLLNGMQAKRVQYDNRATDIEYIGSSTNGFFGPLSTAVPTCEPSYFCYCAIDNDVLYQTGEDICEESYQPMLTPNKTWTYVDFNNTWFDSGSPHHFLEITTTETVVYNEKEYWLIDGHAMREDVTEKKVYIIPDYSNGAREEFVMYDFDVAVGDVVHNLYRVQGGMSLIYCSEADNGLYAVVMDIVRDNGLLKIIVNVMCDTPFDEDFTGAYQQETWIEGVGLDYCPLYDEMKHPSPPYTQHYLLCVLDNANNFSYTTTWGERMGCYLEKYDAISEVPADELLTVKGGVLTLKGVAESTATAVFTPDGQRVMTFTGDKADISALPSGLYILRCGTRTAKFVK